MLPTRVDTAPGVRALTFAAYFVIVVAGLRLAAPLLVPIAVAAFIAIVSLPALHAFTIWRVPRPLAILLIVLIDALALAAIGWIVFESASDVHSALPVYLERYYALESAVLALLQRWGVDTAAIPWATLVQPEMLVDVAGRIVRGVTGMVSTAFLVLLLVVFMLGEAAGLPAKMRGLLGEHAAGAAQFARIVGEVQHYLAIKTGVSLVTGFAIGIGAWLLGVDFALFWGLLAFLLNFIPNIGSIIAAIPAVLIALLQLGLGSAAALAVVYLLVNVVLGNVVDPMLMGRRLGLSTLVVLLSLLFWGWVWGIIGMLLSLPLTMAAKIAFENTRDLRWIAALMEPVRRERSPAAPAAAAGPPVAPGADTPAERAG